MSVYIVTWNLNKEGALYNSTSRVLHGRLNKLETVRDTGLETVRFVSTTMTSEELYNYTVSGILDSNDRILVSKLNSKENFGLLDTSVWSWIEARF